MFFHFFVLSSLYSITVSKDPSLPIIYKQLLEKKFGLGSDYMTLAKSPCILRSYLSEWRNADKWWLVGTLFYTQSSGEPGEAVAILTLSQDPPASDDDDDEHVSQDKEQPGGGYACSECEHVEESGRGLKRHQRLAHPSALLYPCSACTYKEKN